MVEVTDWQRCYGRPWTGLLAPHADHPAKFSRRLVERIFRHCVDEGWARPGDTVLDPFAGIGTGAYYALSQRLNWVGVELEPRLVAHGAGALCDGQANGDGRALCGEDAPHAPHPILGHLGAWQELYRRLPQFDSWAELRQGDSRQLAAVLNGHQPVLVVSSPPYHNCLARVSRKGIGSPDYAVEGQGVQERRTCLLTDFPHEALAVDLRAARARLGVSKAELDRRLGLHTAYSWYEGRGGVEKWRIPTPEHYRRIKEILGLGDQWDRLLLQTETIVVERRPLKLGHKDQDYGQSPGQLGAMPQGDFARAVAGEERAETFWGAAYQVLRQTYQVLPVGGHAVWVVRDRVAGGKRVDFTGQWAALARAVGFGLVHQHRAWLEESQGIQHCLEGGTVEQRVNHKTYYRRDAERKGSPHIDWELVLCMVKAGEPGQFRR